MSNNQQNVMLNRLKAALAEQGKTNRWLSEQLGKSENTISRWCALASQRTPFPDGVLIKYNHLYSN